MVTGEVMSMVKTLDPVASNLHIALASDNIGPRPHELGLPVGVPGHHHPLGPLLLLLLLVLHGQETVLSHQVVSQMTWKKSVGGQHSDFNGVF